MDSHTFGRGLAALLISLDRQCEGLSPWDKQETDSCAFFVEYFHPTELFIIAESEESIGKKNYQTEMKTNFLLSLLVLVLFGTRVMAQSSLLATLNHEGTISSFMASTHYNRLILRLLRVM